MAPMISSRGRCFQAGRRWLLPKRSSLGGARASLDKTGQHDDARVRPSAWQMAAIASSPSIFPGILQSITPIPGMAVVENSSIASARYPCGCNNPAGLHPRSHHRHQDHSPCGGRMIIRDQEHCRGGRVDLFMGHWGGLAKAVHWNTGHGGGEAA